jgi:hypothetical protein
MIPQLIEALANCMFLNDNLKGDSGFDSYRARKGWVWALGKALLPN